jgi:hypothetical protein
MLLTALAQPVGATTYYTETFDYANEAAWDASVWDHDPEVTLQTSGCVSGNCIRFEYADENYIDAVKYLSSINSGAPEGYLGFYAKLVNKQASWPKFLKFFGLPNGTDYSNWTLGTHYYQQAALGRISHGGGSPIGDSQYVIKWNDGTNTGTGTINYSSNQLFTWPDENWHRFVVYWKLNTNGNADGAFRVWIDGVLQLDAQNVVNRADTNPRGFTRFSLGDYTDNATLDSVPTYYIWYDELTIASTYAEVAGAEVYLSDSFESGNLSSPSGTTGSWGNSNTGPGDSVVVSSDRARTGTKSLKFTYSGNADVCDDASAEQRFNIGQSVNEAYVGYYIYFPSNYAHRTPSGCSSNANNNKVFRIWSENADYTGDPIKMGASLEASSVSRLFPEAMKSWVDNGWAIDCNGSMGDVSSVGTLGSWTLAPVDLGKWLHFEFHVKVDEGTGNAAIEFWVDGDLKYSDLTLDYSNSPCVRNYFETGYLMGWANSGFTQDTSIYIDDVVVASEYIGTSSPSTVTCYKDGDGDGYGPIPPDSVTAQACEAPYYLSSQLTSTTDDCDDTNTLIHPGATEICGDGIDQDCSGADLACTPPGLIFKPGRIYNIRGAGEIYSAHGAK